MNLDELIKLEKSLVLKSFTHKDAYLLGDFIAQKAIKESYPIEIYIEKNSDTIFRYVHEGAVPNNHYWALKKAKVVRRFHRSSAFIFEKLRFEKTTFEEKYGQENEYAVTPGAFPIRVEKVDVVGIIAVSGLDSYSDHEIIIEGLKYLKERQNKL